MLREALVALDAGATVCAIVALGMAAVFLVADWRSRTTRWLAGFLTALGCSILLNVVFVRPHPPDALPWVSHLAPLASAAAVVCAAQWLLDIRATIPAGALDTRFGDRMLRFAQLLGALYAGVGTLANAQRARYFVGRVDAPSALGEPWFWVFALPLGQAVIAGTLITLRRRPDEAEARRLAGVAASAPLVASALALSPPWSAYVSAIGQMIFLVGAVQYHVLQGQRGQFLGRFLAPGVADLVRRTGLAALATRERMQISAVAADLRGYTAWTDGRDSAEVIEVLDRFYAIVGRVARRHGATIKDYAGDGVMVLIGAPLADGDHAARALRFAIDLRAALAEAAARSRMPLGAGIGIASGPVSVGVIGRQRLEYAAVGAALNLAARLCERAGAGEILVDQSTGALLGASGAPRERIEAMALKGYAEPRAVWRIAAG